MCNWLCFLALTFCFIAPGELRPAGFLSELGQIRLQEQWYKERCRSIVLRKKIRRQIRHDVVKARRILGKLQVWRIDGYKLEQIARELSNLKHSAKLCSQLLEIKEHLRNFKESSERVGGMLRAFMAKALNLYGPAILASLLGIETKFEAKEAMEAEELRTWQMPANWQEQWEKAAAGRCSGAPEDKGPRPKVHREAVKAFKDTGGVLIAQAIKEAGGIIAYLTMSLPQPSPPNLTKQDGVLCQEYEKVLAAEKVLAERISLFWLKVALYDSNPREVLNNIDPPPLLLQDVGPARLANLRGAAEFSAPIAGWFCPDEDSDWLSPCSQLIPWEDSFAKIGEMFVKAYLKALHSMYMAFPEEEWGEELNTDPEFGEELNIGPALVELRTRRKVAEDRAKAAADGARAAEADLLFYRRTFVATVVAVLAGGGVCWRYGAKALIAAVTNTLARVSARVTKFTKRSPAIAERKTIETKPVFLK